MSFFSLSLSPFSLSLFSCRECRNQTKKLPEKKHPLSSLTTRSENDSPCFESESAIASSVGASSVSATSGESRMSARRAAAGVASISCRNFLWFPRFWSPCRGVEQPAAEEPPVVAEEALAGAGAGGEEEEEEGEDAGAGAGEAGAVPLLAEGAAGLDAESMASRASAPLDLLAAAEAAAEESPWAAAVVFCFWGGKRGRCSRFGFCGGES